MAERPVPPSDEEVIAAAEAELERERADRGESPVDDEEARAAAAAAEAEAQAAWDQAERDAVEAALLEEQRRDG